MTDLSLSTLQAAERSRGSKVFHLAGRCLSFLGIVARDCCNGLLGTGVSMGKAFEMIYVEPYQPRRRDECQDPERY